MVPLRSPGVCCLRAGFKAPPWGLHHRCASTLVTQDSPLLFGRYQLLEQIAQGGMAEVFKAKSYGVEGFEKTVVLKRILPSLANR